MGKREKKKEALKNTPAPPQAAKLFSDKVAGKRVLPQQPPPLAK
jgi:hypothetical protein